MDSEGIAVLYRQGYDCAQCVVKAMLDRLPCDEETAMRTVSCMGMGLLEGSVCGSLLGAMAVIGLRYGSSSADMGSKGLAIVKRAQFLAEFRKRYRGTTCPELMGLDIRRDEDNLRAFREGIYDNFCPEMGVYIISILERMLDSDS